jgi:hypothetical protein
VRRLLHTELPVPAQKRVTCTSPNYLARTFYLGARRGSPSCLPNSRKLVTCCAAPRQVISPSALRQTVR